MIFMVFMVFRKKENFMPIIDVGKISDESQRRREFQDNMRAQTEALKQQAEAAKRQADAAQWQSFHQNSNSQSYTPRYSSGGNIIDSAFRKIAPWIIIPGLILVFIRLYWMYFVSAAIAVICIFVCRNIYRRVVKPEIKIAITVIVSIALIVIVLSTAPAINAKKVTPARNQTPSTQTTQARYMLVNSDALNIRQGPSTGYDVVGQLKKDTRVQVLDNSGQWWRIKYGNIEGYVNSDYLIEEKTPSAPTSSSTSRQPDTTRSEQMVEKIIRISSEPPRMGTTRDPEFQREYQEAVTRYDNQMRGLPPGLVLPSGETVQERVDSGRVYGK
jgi:SH3-like domain-containing protein